MKHHGDLPATYSELAGDFSGLWARCGTEKILDLVRSMVEDVIFDSRSVGRVFASPVLDAACQQVGCRLIQEKGIAFQPSDNNTTLLVATELGAAGGHSEIVKDIVRLNVFGGDYRVVLTDIFNRMEEGIGDALAEACGIPIEISPSVPSSAERLIWLLERIGDIAPRRIVVLNHNQDSVIISALVPDVCDEIIFLHHADHHLCLGVTPEHFVHVDPHNIGYFNCQASLGLKKNFYWPLTAVSARFCKDERSFMVGGRLRTCSSGRYEKFDAEHLGYAYSYTQLIPRFIAVSDSTHIHIGPLTAEVLAEIRAGMKQFSVEPERFIHIPWVPSLGEALQEYGVDLYLSSFPVGGGKASVEAMAVGIPLVMHMSYVSRFFGGFDLAYPEAWVWRTEDDLMRIARAVDGETLRRHSRLARDWFVSHHSDAAFQNAVSSMRSGNCVPVPPLRPYRPDELRSFLSEKANGFAAQRAAETLAQQQAGEVARLNRAIVEKDCALSIQSGEIHRLEDIVTNKDAALATQLAEIRRLNELMENSKEAMAVQTAEIKRLTEMLAEKELAARKLEDELSQRNDELQQRNDELRQRNDELEGLRKSKWFRIRSILLERPFTLAALAKLAYLVIALLMPGAIKRRIAPFLAKSCKAEELASSINPQPVDDSKAYRIRDAYQGVPNRLPVVHVIANFMVGGSSRLVVDLIEYLGETYSHSVVTSFIPNPPAYVGLDITEHRSPSDIAPFLEHYSRIQPAFIHVHYWGDCDEPWYRTAIKAAEELNIPVIENINTPVEPFISSAVKKYVYVSNYVQHVFGQKALPQATVYPGSDFSLFNREDDVRAKDCVGMVYRLERDKLNEDAIKPFIAVARRRPSTHILIVGGGSLLEPFRQATIEAGVEKNFEFTGYVSYEALPGLYQRMTLFVAPVWKESFGQVSPFAMNMKVPVCGYDVGAIGEIVDNPLLLAPPGDAEALATVIINVLDSPELCRAEGERQQRRAQDNFSVQAMIAAYAKIYQEISGKNLATGRGRPC